MEGTHRSLEPPSPLYSSLSRTHTTPSPLPRKLEMMCLTDWMSLQDDDDDEQAAELWAADTSFLWNQKEINVRFMNKILAWRNKEGNFISTKEILSIANEWHQCGIDAGKNVVPRFINDDSKPSSIRIEFIEQGTSKSKVGTVAERVAVTKPTMWLNLAPKHREGDCPSRYKQTIRHEFGHALGMKHEHSHPDAPLLYDETKLEKHVAKVLKSHGKDYSEKAVKGKIENQWAKLIPKETDQPMKSQYDKLSIMHYLIPEQALPSNYQGPQYLQLELSEKDKELIVKHYSEMLTPADSGKSSSEDSGWGEDHVDVDVPKASESSIFGDSVNGQGATTGGSSNVLNEKPDLRLIGMIRYTHDSKEMEYRVIDVIATEWEAIARELGLHWTKLKSISDNYPKNSSHAANEMLRFWRGSDVKATWAKLIKAMDVKEELKEEAGKFEYALLNRIKDN